MPSRKRSKGQARKASKAAIDQPQPRYQLPRTTETQLMETMLTNSQGCTHGCSPISQGCLQFVYEFYSSVTVNVPKCRSVLGASHKALSDVSKKWPEFWHEADDRDLAKACIIANAATILAGDASDKGKQIAGGSVVAVLLMDKYDENEPKESSEIDWKMSGSQHWRLRDTIEGCERLLLSFFQPLLPCGCLDEKLSASKKSCPKSGLCERCFQRNERSHLSVCQGCCLIQYCSRECQRKDWNRHRKFCKAQQAKTKEEEDQGTPEEEDLGIQQQRQQEDDEREAIEALEAMFHKGP